MRDSNLKYWLLVPPIALLIATTLVPVLQVVNYSFMNWRIALSPVPGPYVGFDNYLRAFSDPAFWNSVRVTVAYTALTVFFSLAIGLYVAVTLQHDHPFGDFVKALLIFPFAISLTLRGYSFRFMLLEGQGVLDAMLDRVFPFMANVVWLAHPAWALFWVSVPVFWAWGPLAGLMILGALNAIDRSIFEAARVDGASNVTTFFAITLPLLRPMIVVVVLLVTLFSIRMFDLVLTMTAGGPGRATEMFNFFIYRVGFRFFDIGYASALAVILTVVLVFLSYLYARRLVD